LQTYNYRGYPSDTSGDNYDWYNIYIINL
jgi:hypothetical protein